MLAAVANCGRSRKWCGRGRLALGFKPRHSSHAASFGDHTAWAEKNHGRTSISFSEIRYPGLGRGGIKDCVFVGVLKELWDLNEDIKSFLVSLYNSLNK